MLICHEIAMQKSLMILKLFLDKHLIKIKMEKKNGLVMHHSH